MFYSKQSALSRLIPKSTIRCSISNNKATRPFSTPARYTPAHKKSNSLAAAKPWSELTTPQKGKVSVVLRDEHDD